MSKGVKNVVRVDPEFRTNRNRIGLFNSHFQNFKQFGIPKAQLILTDIPCTMQQIADEVGMTRGNIYKILRKHASTTTNADIEAWQKPLCQCQPREIFDYLRHLGYEGELTYKRKVTI